MFEWLLNLLRETVEWRTWGWSISTVGTIGAVCLAAFQGIGVWKQGRLVHRERNARTLSFLLFGYSMSYFFAACIYGVEQKSIALMILVVNGFLHISVMTGIPKYRGVTDQERRTVGLFFLMIPLMWLATVVGFHEVAFLASLFGLLGFIGPQAYRAWKSPDTSDLNLTMILSFLFGAVFWFVYGVTVVDSWALQAFNPPAFLLWSFILAMWWKKGVDEKRKDELKFKLFLVVFGIILVIVIAQAIAILYLSGALRW